MSGKMSVKVKVKVPMSKMLGKGKKEQPGEGHASGGFLALQKHKAKKKGEESPAHEARESAAFEKAEHGK